MRYFLFLGVSLTVFLFRAGTYLQVEHRVQAQEKSIRKSKIPNHDKREWEPSFQGKVAELATKFKIRKIVGITPETGSRVNISWEGTLRDSLLFLDHLLSQGILSTPEYLQISGLDTSQVRVRGIFQNGDTNIRTSAIDPKEISKLKNVFAPLWEVKKQDYSVLQEKEIRRRDERIQKEQERQEAMIKEREEVEKIENKKKEFETGFALSGIVNNGKEPIAFVKSREGGQTMMLKAGDMLREARVISIDESKGEIQLSYQDKFQIHLRLVSNSEGYR